MKASRIIRSTESGWEGVDPRKYKDDGSSFLGVVRHTLVGGADSDPGLDFEVRYFEVSAGGYSSLERHAHAHAVLIVRGRGMVRLGARREAVRPLDVVYVAPGDVHRFEADDDEALGFVCVVDRVRDRPQVVEEGKEAP